MENENTNAQVQVQPTPQVTIDYDKIAKIVEGKQSVTEDSVLKGYFKQQGMSADEMATAIDMFKKDKAARTPDINALNQQIADANSRAINAEMKVEAMSMATELGVSNAKMPYLLKMADLSQVVADGKVSNDKLKESLEAVLKDIPELKAQAEGSTEPGFKIGADNEDKPGGASQDELKRIFGVK